MKYKLDDSGKNIKLFIYKMYNQKFEYRNILVSQQIDKWRLRSAIILILEDARFHFYRLERNDCYIICLLYNI